MNLEILDPQKRYYSIREVSKAFEVNASLLRYWEKEFSILNPKKNKGRTRYYSPKDVQIIKLIYQLLKERGYTIEGAKKKIESEKQKLNQNIDVVEKLENIKKELLALKNQMSNPKE